MEKTMLENNVKELLRPKAGAKDIASVAREKVKEILATHKPEPIPKDIQKEISQIVKRHDKELSKQS